MKNHWTDQKLINDFITELSEKFASIVSIDAKVIVEFLKKDITDNPPTDDELDELREHKDHWIEMAVKELEDETDKAKDFKKQFMAALDDGLW